MFRKWKVLLIVIILILDGDQVLLGQVLVLHEVLHGEVLLLDDIADLVDDDEVDDEGIDGKILFISYSLYLWVSS